LLIRPGEEFSLVKAIGPVDAALGYRQELVIKEDRTIPEFGGGLCQIGTTFFRLILNAGLPVVERKNHSYRVRYYEPPVGMDATIYEPKPDFRFTNDYPTYLLLQTRIEGDDLVFEFWGTKDGRVATSSTPKVYNVVAPPAPLKIETTEIPVGTTKCIEKAHPGSDAEFTYTVTYPDGQKTDTKFTSHYRPWREICLVGVKELPKSTDGEES
jgi:vancomycin resistance protein YoaR